MAKARVINTRFWDDHYTADLDPIEKLLFLYILTNTSTNISGVYEIPLKKIANETGIDKEMVQKILERFDRDNKVFYVEGWMWVKNFIKNQNQKSPLVQKGIETELKAVPSHIRQIVEEKIKGIDTVSHLTQSNLTKLNSTKSNLTQSICETSFSQEGAKIIEKFVRITPSLKYGNKTQRKACDEMIEKFGLAKTLVMVDKVLEAQRDRYAPRATTPHAMWTKIGDFAVYFNKNSNLAVKI